MTSLLADTERIEVYYTSCYECIDLPCEESYVMNKIVNGKVVGYRRMWRNCEDPTDIWHDTGWGSIAIPSSGMLLSTQYDSQGNLVASSVSLGGVFSPISGSTDLYFSSNISNSAVFLASIL